MPQYFGQLPAIDPPWSTIARVQSVAVSDRSIDLFCGKAVLRLCILAPNLIRVRFTPTGEWARRRSWAVTLDDQDWPSVPFHHQEKENVIEIETQDIRVRIDRDPCQIHFRI